MLLGYSMTRKEEQVIDVVRLQSGDVIDSQTDLCGSDQRCDLSVLKWQMKKRTCRCVCCFRLCI